MKSHDIILYDGEKQIGLMLDGGIQSLDETSQTPSNLIINPGGGRSKRGDPTFSEYEQETWDGGRGGEDYHEDQSKFVEAEGLTTYFSGKLFLSPLWKISAGLRNQDAYEPTNSVVWKAMVGNGTNPYKISISFSASASYSADYMELLIRRVGSPGTLTATINSNSAGNPGSALQTVTKTITDITDYLALRQLFNWASTQSLTSGTTYHIVLYGSATDTQTNHWEVGVDTSATGGKVQSDGSTWQSVNYKPYYRVTIADTDVKYHDFKLTSRYIVSQPPSGNSAVYLWDETNDDWDTTAPTGDSISGQVVSVCVTNNVAIFAFGSGGANIMQFDHNGGAPRQHTDTGVKADLLATAVHPTLGVMLYVADNSTYTIKRYAPVAYNANLAAAAETWTFPTGFKILGMSITSDGAIVARVQNALNKIVFDPTKNDDLIFNLNPDLDKVIEIDRFHPMLSFNKFLYYPFLSSLERMPLSETDVHEDVGLWRGTGLPDGMQGVVSALAPGYGGIYVCNDGGSTNTSAVYFYDNRVWHEIWRAWRSGLRIRNVWWEPQNGTTSPARLWINCGNDLIYIQQPDNSLNPLNDSDSRYVWEGHVISTTHDFNAIQLKKLYEALDIISGNLAQNVSIVVDFQFDKDVGSTTWTPISEIFTSPVAHVKIGEGDKLKARYRLRLRTSSNSITPKVTATVMLGNAVEPIKRQWNLRIKTSDFQHTKTGAPDNSPITLHNFLLQTASSARLIRMSSDYLAIDEIYVKIMPSSIFPISFEPLQKKITAAIQVTLLEAESRYEIKH